MYIFIHYTHPSISESGRAIWQVSSGSFPVKKERKKKQRRRWATAISITWDQATSNAAPSPWRSNDKNNNNCCCYNIQQEKRTKFEIYADGSSYHLIVGQRHTVNPLLHCSFSFLLWDWIDYFESVVVLYLQLDERSNWNQWIYCWCYGLVLLRMIDCSETVSNELQSAAAFNATAIQIRFPLSCSKFITLISVLHDTKPIIGNGGCRVRIDSPCNPSSFVASCKARK